MMKVLSTQFQLKIKKLSVLNASLRVYEKNWIDRNLGHLQLLAKQKKILNQKIA